MMNKKVITAITASVSLAIIGSVSLGIYALSITDKDKENNKSTKPLNRGDDYEQVNLSTHFDKSKIKDLIVVIDNEKTKPILDKDKFKHYIDLLIKDALGKIERFKNHLDEYKVVISYQFTSNCSIALDVVWYIPKSNAYHYFDQFEILLKAN